MLFKPIAHGKHWFSIYKSMNIIMKMKKCKKLNFCFRFVLLQYIHDIYFIITASRVILLLSGIVIESRITTVKLFV